MRVISLAPLYLKCWLRPCKEERGIVAKNMLIARPPSCHWVALFMVISANDSVGCMALCMLILEMVTLQNKNILYLSYTQNGHKLPTRCEGCVLMIHLHV